MENQHKTSKDSSVRQKIFFPSPVLLLLKCPIFRDCVKQNM